jgi:hypothetical protein
MKVIKKTKNEIVIQTDKKGKNFVHAWVDASGNIIIETEKKGKKPKFVTHKVFVPEVILLSEKYHNDEEE